MHYNVHKYTCTHVKIDTVYIMHPDPGCHFVSDQMCPLFSIPEAAQDLNDTETSNRDGCRCFSVMKPENQDEDGLLKNLINVLRLDYEDLMLIFVLLFWTNKRKSC